MSEGDKTSAHTRKLTKLRVERHRKRRREDENDETSDIPRTSPVDIGDSVDQTVDIDINEEEFISIELDDNTGQRAEQFRMENQDLNVSDEFSQLEEAMRLSWSDNKLSSCNSIASEIDEDEASMSETEDNHFHQEEGEISDEEILMCEEEFNEKEELRQWCLKSKISHTCMDLLLKILRRRLMPSLPATSKTFLETASSTYKIETIDNEKDHTFVYFGLSEHLKKIINVKLHPDNRISLLIHVDGSSPYKSSDKQFWPILGKVFFEPDLYEVFPIAIYCGPGKPKNVHRYFEKFVEEINAVMEEGIIIEARTFTVGIKAFICDRPARSIIKCVKNHGAKAACERCIVEGKRVERRTVYLSTNAAARTDQSFRSQQDPLHHDGQSPLTAINPPIDTVQDFVLDAMHLLFLGIMKKFLVDIWIGGNRAMKFSYTQKNLFSSYLLMIKSQVPQEFQRSTASLTDVGKWKATQFRFLTLYAGPIILKKCLEEKLYKHFLLFHVACRILSCKQLALSMNTRAKRFLQIFVQLCEKLYGKYTLVLNVHSLIHVADDAMYMQCSLSDINAFPFESALGKIKNMLRSGYRPLAQVARRLHEQFFVHTTKPQLPPAVNILQKLRPDASGKTLIKKIAFRQAILTTKSPNNSVLLKNGELMEIDSIFILPTETRIGITGKTLQIKKPMLEYPCDSSVLNMWCVSRRRSQEISCYLVDIRNKMVTLDVSTEGKEDIYSMPLLHSY